MLSVFVPSLALAFLAFRSVRAQELVLERQRAFLYQGLANSLVKDILDLLSSRQREFAQQIEALLAAQSARELAAEFERRITQAWPLAEVGFAVSFDGQMFSPSLLSRPEARRFRLENERFLTSSETAQVYWNGPKGQINLSALDEKETSSEEFVKGFAGKSGSRSAASPAEFRQLVGNQTQGSLARFLQNRLKLLVWYRPPGSPDLIFGAQVKLPALVEQLRSALTLEEDLRSDICVALLNESDEPVALSHPGFSTDWKHPSEAAEIGDSLPHWKVAIGLINPQRLRHSANTLKAILSMIIAVLLMAIVLGGWLISRELRREWLLVRQRTDFVSNVSHELKTPLTSIRMFSELLAEGRVADPEKQKCYLNIIGAESARLTRLINNILDFSRLERGEKKYRFEQCDLRQVVREVCETFRPHLEEKGFTLECRLPAQAVYVRGDADALAQVLINLVSNAEKYSSDMKRIELELDLPKTPGEPVNVKVMDRGLGVPPGCEQKIFQEFFRAHDSLSSGIPGSGLGLTLARQLARAHSGDVTYSPRSGGGSIFVLTLTA